MSLVLLSRLLAAIFPPIMRPLSVLTQASAAIAACNGHEALCDRRYSDITQVGSHNSAFVGVLPMHNQFVSVTRQLNHGVRFLQAQTHDKDGEIELCHAYCWELDVGPLTKYLRELSKWLDGHPDEVVTLLLTNPDGMPITQYDEDFEAAGLKDYVFRPNGTLSRDDWPTLQEMIDAGDRLVVFMDFDSDQSQVDYILDEFHYFWETPYGITNDKFPTCDVQRPLGGDTTQLMGIMNHMLNYRVLDVVFPDMDSARDTNSLESILAQVALCVGEHSVQPSVILLDWINVGEAIDAQETLNDL